VHPTLNILFRWDANCLRGQKEKEKEKEKENATNHPELQKSSEIGRFSSPEI